MRWLKFQMRFSLYYHYSAQFTWSKTLYHSVVKDCLEYYAYWIDWGNPLATDFITIKEQACIARVSCHAFLWEHVTDVSQLVFSGGWVMVFNWASETIRVLPWAWLPLYPHSGNCETARSTFFCSSVGVMIVSLVVDGALLNQKEKIHFAPWQILLTWPFAIWCIFWRL